MATRSKESVREAFNTAISEKAKRFERLLFLFLVLIAPEVEGD